MHAAWPAIAITIRLFSFIVLSQFLASLIVDHMEAEQLEMFRRFLHSHPWEKEGDFYQRHFDVKKWKDRLPEMGNNTPTQFRKNKMLGIKPEYLYQFVLETVRAELCHMFALIFGYAILFCNPHVPGLFFLSIYVTLINLPFIIIQRYNRPRLEKVLERIVKSQEGVIIPAERLYT